MAEEQPELLSSFFPDPPPFYKYFTPENIEALQQFETRQTGKNDNEASSPQLSASQLLSLPTELRYMVPPEPPARDNDFRVFGETTKVRGTDEFKNIVEWIGHALNDAQPPLEDWEYKQLYQASPPSPTAGDDPADSSIDRQSYLFRFLRSALLSFVELLGIAAVDKTSPQSDEKLKNILTLVTNMHALINEYRPHQARETLISIMETQLERKKAEVAGIKRMSQKVEETLREFAKNAPDTATSLVSDQDTSLSAEERRKASQRHMWQVMDELMGY